MRDNWGIWDLKNLGTTKDGLKISAWKEPPYMIETPTGCEKSVHEGEIVTPFKILAKCRIKGKKYDYSFAYNYQPTFRTFIDFIKNARVAVKKINENPQ